MSDRNEAETATVMSSQHLVKAHIFQTLRCMLYIISLQYLIPDAIIIFHLSLVN